MSILLALRAALPMTARLLPYLAIAGVVLWVMGMRATIAEQRRDIATVTARLATETAARQRDVAALTALSAGLTTAAAARTKDQAILERTVNATTATPVSPALRDLLAGLREADAGRDVPAPAGRTGGAAAR